MSPDHAATNSRGRPLPPAVFARLVLILGGTVWLGPGIPGLLHPRWLADLTDLQLPDTLALQEFRAELGGLSLAIATLHYLAATRAGYLVPGLVASLLLDVGLCTGRITSLVLDPGVPGVVGLLLPGIETVMIALCGMALGRIGKLSLARRREVRAARAAEAGKLAARAIETGHDRAEGNDAAEGDEAAPAQKRSETESPS